MDMAFNYLYNSDTEKRLFTEKCSASRRTVNTQRTPSKASNLCPFI